MPVHVARRAPLSPQLPVRAIRARAERMLRELDLPEAELSVLLTDDENIQELNARYRNKPKPTDVLAFPIEDAAPHPSVARLLGDVVVSLDTAARQAQKRRRELIDEVTHLLAHGLLHLVGYDHQTDAEERRMNAETRRLVAAATAARARR